MAHEYFFPNIFVTTTILLKKNLLKDVVVLGLIAEVPDRPYTTQDPPSPPGSHKFYANHIITRETMYPIEYLSIITITHVLLLDKLSEESHSPHSAPKNPETS